MIGKHEKVWDEVFHDGKKHAIAVEKDGVIIHKGFVKYSSYGHNQTKELYLDQIEVLEKRTDVFDELKGVYMDFSNGIIIREYDLQKAYSQLNKN